MDQSCGPSSAAYGYSGACSYSSLIEGMDSCQAAALLALGYVHT